MNEIVAGIQRIVALELWHVGAVRVNLETPFRLVSGNYSPIYINCRQLISSRAFVDLFAASARLVCEHSRLEFDTIAGGETAGIPFAAFLSRCFALPMVYVRKASKSHGISSLIEGTLGLNARVLLVEDLITDAGSKLKFVDAVAAAGGRVEDVLVVFDRLQGGREALQARSIRLHAITDMKIVLETAKATGIASQHELEGVEQYLASPREWHAGRGISYLEPNEG